MKRSTNCGVSFSSRNLTQRSDHRHLHRVQLHLRMASKSDTNTPRQKLLQEVSKEIRVGRNIKRIAVTELYFVRSVAFCAEFAACVCAAHGGPRCADDFQAPQRDTTDNVPYEETSGNAKSSAVASLRILQHLLQKVMILRSYCIKFNARIRIALVRGFHQALAVPSISKCMAQGLSLRLKDLLPFSRPPVCEETMLTGLSKLCVVPFAWVKITW